MEKTFEQIVDAFYEALYRFALSLAQNEAEACDLTQQTFYLWAAKGYQLRDRSKVKTWLFTTLYHEFLGTRRREQRHPQVALDEATSEIPPVSSRVVDEMDAVSIVQALGLVDPLYRAPLVLFYLEDHSYLEIAECLDIPAGTVMSRLARGKAQLRSILATDDSQSSDKIVPISLHTPTRKKSA